MLRPYPADGLDFYPVSQLVNKAERDDPRCVERANLVEDNTSEPTAVQGELF